MFLELASGTHQHSPRPAGDQFVHAPALKTKSQYRTTLESLPEIRKLRSVACLKQAVPHGVSPLKPRALFAFELGWPASSVLCPGRLTVEIPFRRMGRHRMDRYG